MAVYRLKHLPTGLYYIPVRKVKNPLPGAPWYVKSNLSRTGKLYSSPPSLKRLGGSYYDHTKPINPAGRYHGQAYPVMSNEWGIEVVV